MSYEEARAWRALRGKVRAVSALADQLDAAAAAGTVLDGWQSEQDQAAAAAAIRRELARSPDPTDPPGRRRAVLPSTRPNPPSAWGPTRRR